MLPQPQPFQPNTPTVYTDFYTSFDINPVTGDLAVVSNQYAIIQSIRNLILTNFYDRPFEPTVGSQITASLFEDFSDFTKNTLESYIINCIQNFEPRAELLEVIVNEDEDNSQYTVVIVFTCISTNTPVSFTLQIPRIH